MTRRSFLKILLFTFFAFRLSAQTANKYQSLLWEITGNGLEKPSYLYGTMHVSKKVAYHLSDKFFAALKKVDVVGLETNPNEWLDNMKKYGTLSRISGGYEYNRVSYDFYNNAFQLNLPTNSQIASLLSNDANIINGLLYRYSGSKDNFEEATYIDLFIYQIGSKWGKKLISLEDYKLSEILAQRSTMPDPEASKDYSYTSRKTKGYYSMDEAYRRGDLDGLDSLSRVMNTNRNHRKYLIDERNIIMANTMDSVMKKQALFSGIGAAHLPGPDGVIELLRRKGYTVTPVFTTSEAKGKKLQEQIEETFKPLPTTLQYNSDSLFSCELPAHFIKMGDEESADYSLCTDMTNGAYYTFSRMRTMGVLFGVTAEKMLKKLDSLFYENIPGKIISKKEITSNTGMKGFDIVNLTRRGDYQRYQVFVTDMEILMIKLGGHGKFVRTKEGDHFFNSIKFYTKGNTGNIITYSPPTGGFEIKIPDNYFYHKNSGGKRIARGENLVAYDKSKDLVINVEHAYYNETSLLEEDTFELNVLCNRFLKNNDYKKGITRKINYEQGLPCIYFSAQKQGEATWGKICIKGTHYYMVEVRSKPENEIKAKEYLASFKLKNFNYINPRKEITDDTYFFKAMDEAEPGENNEIEDALKADYKKLEEVRNKGKYRTDYKSENKNRNYYSFTSFDQVNVEYYKYNDYDYRDKNEIWNRILRFYRKNGSMVLSSYTLIKNDPLPKIEITLKDTATQRAIHIMRTIKNGMSYIVSTAYDTVAGMSAWQTDFFKTFRPLDSAIGKDIFVNKFPQLLKDLSSADSNKKYASAQSLADIDFQKEYVDDFIAYLKDTVSFLGLTEEIRASLLEKGGTLKSDKILPLYKNIYAKNAENGYLQLAVLKGLANLRTGNSYNLLAELFKTEPPLVGNEDDVDAVFKEFYDSLELAKNLFPALFTVTDYQEYKTPAYRLLATLVEKGLISQSICLPRKASILREASYELKRFNVANSSAANSNQTSSLEEIVRDEAERASKRMSATYSKNSTDGKDLYNYNSMLENFSILLAPYYATDPLVKKFFDKETRIKNEARLLDLSLLWLKNKIPVNDTIWKYYSKNNATRVRLYAELEKAGATDKFDKTYLSQEGFCKATLLSQFEFKEVKYSYDSKREMEKKQSDSVSFIKKVEVHNKYDKGFFYFYKRHVAKNDKKIMVWVFVRNSNSPVSTDVNVLETKYVMEKHETEEEVIDEAVSNFFYKHRGRFVSSSYNFRY